MKCRNNHRKQKGIKRKICVVTGGRPDYGLLRPLLKEIQSDKDLQLQIIATCMHISKEFGNTYKEIKKDSFYIDKKIDLNLNADTPVGVSKSIGIATGGLAKAYKALQPDIVVLAGDRFELLGAATAALISRIPIAHIHGGEITQGAFDDAIRHSITKMSHLHFTSAEEYRRRVIQLGEVPERVFNVGALGIDNIKNTKLLSKEEVEKELGFKFNKHNFLITFHPVTLEDNTSKEQFKNILDALNELKETNLIFTRANADTYGKIINKMTDNYVSKNFHKARVFAYMGQLKYLSTMQFVDAVIGNSSSGIIEAPSFRVGTINIGDREEGRIRTESIIDCKPTRSNIRRAIRQLYSSGFQRNLKKTVSPYGDGNAAKRIKKILKTYKIDNIIKKTFYNIAIYI